MTLWLCVVLLVIIAAFAWRIMRWASLIATQLGCSPKRTNRIRQLTAELDRYRAAKEFRQKAKLSDAEAKDLEEELNYLMDSAANYGPAFAGQLVRVLDHLETLTGLVRSQSGAASSGSGHA